MPHTARPLSISRSAHGVLFVALLAACVAVAAGAGHWGALPAGALGPDLALLIGMAPGLERGQLHPRAVALYNVLHHPAGPAMALAAATVLGTGWLVAGLAWAAHIAADRALGYGLRTREGFQRAG